MTLINLIDFGIVLIDAGGAPLARNRAAVDCISAWCLFAEDDEAPLAPPQQRLRAAIARACRSRSRSPKIIDEVIFAGPDGSAGLLVTVVTLPQDDAGTTLPLGARCALFFRDGRRHAKVRDAALLMQFGFTPAEMRLAQALLDGRTLDECCCYLQRTKNTLRGHMKTMLAKAGVHRQGQLLSLILKTTPQIRLD